MTAKIIPIGNVTKLDVPIENVLESARSELEGCVLIGFRPDGKFYAASSYADGGTVMWLLEACKKMMLEPEE